MLAPSLVNAPLKWRTPLKWTALRIPPLRRLYDHRDQLASELAEANRTIAALRAEQRERNAQWAAADRAHGAGITELTARLARSEEVAAQLTRSAGLDRPLAFLHVPKTSGLAIGEGIRNVLPTTAYVGGVDLSVYGDFRDFDTIDPRHLATSYINGLPAARGADFIAGHIAYSTIVSGRPEARRMTVLREPRARTVSHWVFWRAMSDEELAPWGGWGTRASLARRPIIEFLSHPEVVGMIDNVAVRLLLWPHPLIPDGDFIAETSDQRLIDDALARLRSFHFADVVENPRLEENIRAFLARPFVRPRVNETQAPPPELRRSLQAELTDEALQVIGKRSRLDRHVWQAVVAQCMPGVDVQALADQAFARTVAHHSKLMAP